MKLCENPNQTTVQKMLLFFAVVLTFPLFSDAACYNCTYVIAPFVYCVTRLESNLESAAHAASIGRLCLVQLFGIYVSRNDSTGF
jgi:hypothetical protein